MRKTERQKALAAYDQELMRKAEELMNSDSPALYEHRDLILEIFRTLLDERWAKNRLKLVLTSEQTTRLEGKLYDDIAAVICRTYAELGDVAPLADDEALVVIREMLLAYDAGILDRNRFRRLQTDRWRPDRRRRASEQRPGDSHE